MMYKNILAGLVFIIVAGLIAGVTYAHDASQPKLKPWFDKLASSKGLCCSFADGYIIDDADWEAKDGRYRVNIPTTVDGAILEWVDVPADALITEPNLAGKTMVWPLYGYMGVSVRCFMPGPMG